MNAISEKIMSIGVVPVIKLNNPERDAVDLAEALVKGGVPVAEVTFRAAGAAKAIKLMSENVPEMLVGAGTVLTTEQVDAAIAALDVTGATVGSVATGTDTVNVIDSLTWSETDGNRRFRFFRTAHRLLFSKPGLAGAGTHP